MNWTKENDKYQVRLQRIYKDRYGSEEYIEMQTITDASVISFYKKDEITNVFMWLADFDKNSTTEAELFWNILTQDISIERYKNLLDSELMLTSLEEAGVDNWNGYGEAYELFKQYKKEQ